jgi:DNA-directed RNA polymerase delta subunit
MLAMNRISIERLVGHFYAERIVDGNFLLKKWKLWAYRGLA